jgi:hypothetical protein
MEGPGEARGFELDLEPDRADGDGARCVGSDKEGVPSGNEPLPIPRIGGSLGDHRGEDFGAGGEGEDDRRNKLVDR